MGGLYEAEHGQVTMECIYCNGRGKIYFGFPKKGRGYKCKECGGSGLVRIDNEIIKGDDKMQDRETLRQREEQEMQDREERLHYEKQQEEKERQIEDAIFEYKYNKFIAWYKTTNYARTYPTNEDIEALWFFYRSGLDDTARTQTMQHREVSL